MSRASRVVIVPRWSGTGDSAWYSWLRETLHHLEFTTAELRPLADAPEIAPTLASIEEAVGSPARLPQTLLIGHSVGGQAVMRYLATRPGRAAGALLVAGWWWLDDTWPPVVPWIEEPFDAVSARIAAGEARVLLSDDDPFTADHLGTATLFEERLGARVIITSGGGHFNGNQEQAVLDALSRPPALARARRG